MGSISILEKTPCVLFIFEPKISIFGSSISAIEYDVHHGLDDDNLRFLDDCQVCSIVRVVGLLPLLMSDSSMQWVFIVLDHLFFGFVSLLVTCHLLLDNNYLRLEDNYRRAEDDIRTS